MIVFPNCKINLGLHIVAKREDGFHDLETCFYPVPLHDILEVITLKNEKPGTIRLVQSGITIEGNEEDNICVKAYRLLNTLYPGIPAIQLNLFKQIPMGAGLGGGSADAAFFLQLMNSLFELNIPSSGLTTIALQLGSDCPFFLLNKPCMATGRGENLKEISLNLQGWKLLLINPGIHVSTADAFKGANPQKSFIDLEEQLMQPVENWKNKVRNQFEETVFPKFPVLQKIKEELYQAGAIYASMSGSGSTLFALFKTQSEKAEQIAKDCHFYKWLSL